MISLSNVLKHNEQGLTVRSYEYCLDFTNEKSRISHELDEMDTVAHVSPFEGHGDAEENITLGNSFENDIMSNEALVKEAKMQSYAILDEAKREAAEICRLAQINAETLKSNAIKEGKEQGYDEGYKMGYEKAYADSKEKMDEESRVCLTELENIIKSTELQKEEVINRYLDDLKNLSLAVAEKVVHISLKTSGDVIKKMIISATEKLKAKEWAKIYIAKCDASLLIEGNKDILDAISHLSKNLKVIVMENEKPGTCIIELPDEIIDASAGTQIENIKGILNNAGTYGGKIIV